MKRLILSIVLSSVTIYTWGQDLFTPILQQIEQNSLTLKALQQQIKSEKLLNKTGLTPENPEVELGFLWSQPSTPGMRKEVSVSQTFDFPTAYLQRNKLSTLQNNSLEHHYRTERMQLLLSAKKLCIELTFQNKLHRMYARQLENAQKMATAFETLLQKGETNRLEYNKVQLNYATIKNELERIDVERNALLTELTVLNGGISISWEYSDLLLPELPDNFEEWYTTAETQNPALQHLRSQVEVAQRQVKLSKAEGLPKLAVGYMGEFMNEEKFQGISVGISIPLWQNKNRVKQARAAVVASQRMVEDGRVQYYQHLQGLYRQATHLKESVALYTTALKEHNNEELLLKAFHKGELSLLEYLLEMEYYYEIFEKQASAERDLAQLVAELTAYAL